MLEGLRALEPVELYKYCFSEPVPETLGGQQSVENSTQHRFRPGKPIEQTLKLNTGKACLNENLGPIRQRDI